MSSPDRLSAPLDPAARPRPLAQRLQLLLIVLILPIIVVTLPTLFVTGIFGQRPRHAAPVPTPDTTGLKAALNLSATSLLPTPAPLTPDTIRVTVRPEHVAARAEKVAGQAKLLGGSAVEGVSAVGEKHLFVDLPAGCTDAFRQAVTSNDPPVAPATTPAPGAARDQVEVLIRSAAEDE